MLKILTITASNSRHFLWQKFKLKIGSVLWAREKKRDEKKEIEREIDKYYSNNHSKVPINTFDEKNTNLTTVKLFFFSPPLSIFVSLFLSLSILTLEKWRKCNRTYRLHFPQFKLNRSRARGIVSLSLFLSLWKRNIIREKKMGRKRKKEKEIESEWKHFAHTFYEYKIHTIITSFSIFLPPLSSFFLSFVSPFSFSLFLFDFFLTCLK